MNLVILLKLHEKDAIFGDFCIYFVQNMYICSRKNEILRLWSSYMRFSIGN